MATRIRVGDSVGARPGIFGPGLPGRALRTWWGHGARWAQVGGEVYPVSKLVKLRKGLRR